MKVKVYGLRFVNSYQDGMSLSQIEHLFGSKAERSVFLKTEDWDESEVYWDDEEGYQNGYEGWQAFEQELVVEIPG